jgi:DNA-binding NarL/FixJ family response regulator
LTAFSAVGQAEVDLDPLTAEAIGPTVEPFFAQSSTQAVAAFPDLTSREQDILRLIAQGLTNTAIADRLSLSPKTVRNQVSTIFSKLQVTTPILYKDERPG